MRARRIVAVTAAAGLVLGIAVVIAMNVSQTKRGNLLTDDPRTLRLGAEVYQQRCAACHGAKLEGQANWRERGGDGVLPAPPHDASGHTWHHPDDVLFRITKYGVAKVANVPNYRSNMPPFEGGLTDAEIVAVLSWIRAQWPEDIRSEQERINKEYKTKQRD
jgi:mono/diheme cytochrome c family protein